MFAMSQHYSPFFSQEMTHIKIHFDNVAQNSSMSAPHRPLFFDIASRVEKHEQSDTVSQMWESDSVVLELSYAVQRNARSLAR